MIYLNNEIVNFGEFPNKEINLPIQVLKTSNTNNIIKFDYTDNLDIFKLGMLKNYLDEINCPNISLYISYMPYSRMDRVNGIFSVSLKYTAKIINNMNFIKILVREPHSNVTIENLNNSSPEWWVFEQIPDVISLSDADTIFFPDNGAKDRYKTNEIQILISFGYKKRDFSTGNITEYYIKGDVGKNILIVDDLCSRGGTFIQASK